MAAVEVWKIRLDAEPEPFAMPLSDRERERAAKFHFERDRRRFTVAHAALRLILGACSGIPAATLEVQQGPHGKPFLAQSTLRFNLSHSGELALCAVAPGLEVGVDVERLRAMPDFMAVARRFFTPEETSALERLREAELQAAFFRTWTRKEAFVKGTGKGIAGLADPCAPPWTIVSLDVEPEYAAALAVEGVAEIAVREFRFPRE